MKKSKDDLTYEYVASRLEYNPKDGLLIWKPKAADCGEASWRRWNTRYAGTPAGSFMTIRVGRERKTVKTYRRVHLGTRDYLSHRIAWLLHYGEWPSLDIDHINGISTDNRIANLRKATKSQNSSNRKNYGQTSQYRGVSWHRAGWYAQLKQNQKHILAKHFASEEAAARAYDEAAKVAFGAFAVLNFPDAA
ncbi:HNH endonuclease [Sphingobium sp. PNB]|uniref:HNH endonuclease signature motif containing protein n=1 Tax=Sphingobium sp. PNB TaxID=863934 RepID=UPI001CA3C8F8|nr:HNH endonuclease signature motif containing protein [Sphingobium sp. PNB]MCB4861962.1 HNH endonuclease [Sphingobium sp. PNB]